MKFGELELFIKRSNEHNILFLGDSGVGKTSFVKGVFGDTKRYLLLIPPPLNMLNIEDLVGIPRVIDDVKYKYIPPNWLYDALQELGDRQLVIFWDEITRASQEIRNALISATDKFAPRIGDFYLPYNVLNIAAGNPLSYQDTEPLGQALMSRFILINVEPDVDFWKQKVSGIHKVVEEFINMHSHLFVYVDKKDNQQNASPRSWEVLSEVLAKVAYDDEESLLEIICGIIGEHVGLQFYQFYKVNAAEHIPDAVSVLRGKESFPKDIANQWIVARNMVNAIRQDPKLIKHFVKRSIDYPVEIVVGGIVVPLKESGFLDKNFQRFTSCAGWVEWYEKYIDVLAGILTSD